MPKLHELLAVEGQLKGQAQATRTDLRATFEKKRHLFEKKILAFQPLEENMPVVIEQHSELESTVPKELDWIADVWRKALDVSYQVAEANTKARADVVLDDGTVLLTNVPATALLELEKRSAEIQELVTAAPTLDSAKSYVPDPDAGAGVYKAREVRTQRTKKAQRVLVLLQPTPEHPGQAQVISEDVPVGTVTAQEWSSALTIVQKADMLERAESLRRAIKAARMRANEVSLESDKLPTVGDKLFNFVFKGSNGKA